MSRPVVITIDGPAASGKTSVSRDLANSAGWKWVSTGLFYRGLAYVAIQEKVSLDEPEALAELAGSSIWSVEMSAQETSVFYKDKNVTKEASAESNGMNASKISQYPEVRKALLAAQRACANTEYTLVAEGRDCGTVVFPEAVLKVYLTASSNSRAMRRSQEKSQDFQALKDLQKQRDQQDAQRAVAPMQAADDAEIVDTSTLNLKEVVAEIALLARKKGLKI